MSIGCLSSIGIVLIQSVTIVHVWLISGGPFDLMSRRIIAASSKTLAERIAREIQVVPFQRDDED